MTDLPMTAPKPLLADILMTLFVRIVALGCLAFGIRIWGELTGYSAHGSMRFDLLGSDIMAVKASLAVLYPVAAVGLWLKGAWGPVIWSVAAALEIGTHQMFPDTFGANTLKLAATATTVLAYVILRLAIILTRPQKTPRP
jgi:hypothetical protein